MSATPVFKLAETELRPGASLIEASAGTGKTFTIAGIFLRLILEQKLSVRDILVVTYTTAATEELRHRIRTTLANALAALTAGATEDPFLRSLLERGAAQRADWIARLDGALYGFDEAPIYTIHGFCQRVLKDRAFETGSLFDTELVTDQEPLLRQLVEDFWRREFYRAGKIPSAFALKNKLKPGCLLPLIHSSLCHPFLQLLSPVKDRTVEALGADLEEKFGALRQLWASEGETIRGIFGDHAKWANSPYNRSDKMAGIFRLVTAGFDAPDPTEEALDALMLFRRSEIEHGVTKRGKHVAPRHEFFDRCEELAVAEGHFVIGAQFQALQYVRGELPRRKEEQKIQFYDDLLTRLHGALAGEGGKALADVLRQQYKAALIDEFQDTDPLQYEIFHGVFAGADHFLFLIGDPKQAIYGFRGADIFTYLEASRQAGQRFTLTENWRSESGLVRAVNTVFGASSQPFVFSGIGFHPVEARGEADKQPLQADGRGEAPLQVWFRRREAGEKEINKGAAEAELAESVASEMAALLAGGVKLGDRSVQPEDLAVLVPRNKQAQLMQDALKRRGIPSVLHTDASLFAAHEMRETRRVLEAIADPGREANLFAALGTDLLGRTSSQLETLAADESQGEAVLERFRGYLDLWLQRGFIQMFRRFLQQEQVRPRLLAFPDGERRLTNLLHAAEVLQRASLEHRLGVAGLLKWIDEQQQADGQVAEEHQLRLETDERAAKIVTIHKSKGLEYPVVFCPFSWNGATIEHRGEEQVFFHENGDGWLVRDLGSDAYETNKQKAMVEKLAEQVRLLYVALTRAKHRCYFAWGAFKGAGNSAPAWLLHPPSEPGADPATALEEHFKDLGDEELLGALGTLANKSGDAGGRPAIEVRDLPAPTDETFAPSASAGTGLDCRKFSGTIPRDWRISSFSSLTANHGEEAPDHDETGAAAVERLPATGIFAFPGGAKAGSCLHAILEQVDFTRWDRPETQILIQEQLRAHGFAEPAHQEAIFQMLGNVMTAPLDTAVPGLSLSKVPAAQRLQELEFYFPIQKISPPQLAKLLGASQSGGEAEGMAEGFAFAPVRGMLKGFIDLTFEFNGRYYVVDWKSNWLGNRVEDYGAAAMTAEIRRRHYYFQYQLYTVALDRYLRHRLAGYSYEQHFGGVFYLFLRGVDPARPEFGIFRDRPTEKFIRELEAALTGAAGPQGLFSTPQPSSAVAHRPHPVSDHPLPSDGRGASPAPASEGHGGTSNIQHPTSNIQHPIK